ncbi:MAG: 3',5'-cyclic adenosine monophosphate phosphodiesterase CpdA [Steroidobacteraceae bacterium]|nr:3',5'-cyclic adenosine monophosphate phosphodiesterase CpdA [Steroidobacteraceae bacterium]
MTTRLIQFTDPHLYGDAAATLRGIATLPALERVIAHARARYPDPSAYLVTGDLVQDDPGGYAALRRLLAALDRPVHCIPGNHDLIAEMRAALAGPPFVLGGHFDSGAWRIVMLDSSVPGTASGTLAPAALAQLDHALGTAGTRPALVCLHHHPVDMGSRWLDQVGLVNRDDFLAVIDHHPNVRAVLWGHVHQEFDGVRHGVRLLATPSTCAQFLPGADDFAVDPKPPAYRVVELHDDGRLETRVEWVIP